MQKHILKTADISLICNNSLNMPHLDKAKLLYMSLDIWNSVYKYKDRPEIQRQVNTAYEYINNISKQFFGKQDISDFAELLYDCPPNLSPELPEDKGKTSLQQLHEPSSSNCSDQDVNEHNII